MYYNTWIVHNSNTRGILRKIRSCPHSITAKIIPVTVVTAGFFLITISTPAGFPRKPAGLYLLLHPCKSLVHCKLYDHRQWSCVIHIITVESEGLSGHVERSEQSCKWNVVFLQPWFTSGRDNETCYGYQECTCHFRTFRSCLPVSAQNPTFLPFPLVTVQCLRSDA